MSAARTVDPRLRVLYLLAVAVGVFLLPDWRLLLGALVAQVLLWFVVRLPAHRLGRQVTKLWVFALFIVGSYSFFTNDPATDEWITLSLAGVSTKVNKSGSLVGLMMVMRVYAVVIASHVARAGDPRAVVAGLSKLHVPKVIAMSLDVVLALLGDSGGRGRGRGRGRGGGRGGGGGGGGGGGRGGGGGDEEAQAGFWQSVKRLARGDVAPLMDRLVRQIARAEEHTEKTGGDMSPALRRDVAIIGGVALTMMAIKMLKLLPSLPFAPGHKMVLLTPLYIAASMLTRSRFGATLTGITMGSVAFLLGDGRYGIWEILKHITPGLICDLCVPLMVRRERVPGAFWWSLLGGGVAVGRFATIFTVTLSVQAPAVAYAILVPGLTANVFFGLTSGYVSYQLARAVLKMPQRHDKSPPDQGEEAEAEAEASTSAS